jgi:glycosyltransferase involved in cell wall biosynthesis
MTIHHSPLTIHNGKTQFILFNICKLKSTEYLRKKIIVSVISDLVTDQRVQKECNTLYKMGYDILLIGRQSKQKFLLNQLPYKTIRFPNLFNRGPLMYLMFNLQLFFYLLFKKADVLWANDLDTLLPNYWISRLKNIRLVYDSHEYFTESVYKRSSKKIWEKLENFLFPRLKNVITVNDSIKKVYEEKFRVPITVIRNVPYRFIKKEGDKKIILPDDKKILIIQGMGLNENRGAEEAIEVMQFLPDDFALYFIGNGTILNQLKQMVSELQLQSKVTFIDALPYDQMMGYTTQTFLGLIFEKIDVSDEHRFSLPNKFFDYLLAGIPVLSSEAPEIKRIIEEYNVGDFIVSFDPKEIAQKIVSISKDEEAYKTWKYNTVKASANLNWENEEKVLINFMNRLK